MCRLLLLLWRLLWLWLLRMRLRHCVVQPAPHQRLGWGAGTTCGVLAPQRTTCACRLSLTLLLCCAYACAACACAWACGACSQEGDFAVQLYYIRPRFGDFFWDSVKATKLRVMLEAAIQRRFPKGLKVCAPLCVPVVCRGVEAFVCGLRLPRRGWGGVSSLFTAVLP